MTHYERLKRKRLGDILVDEGAATREVVIAALHSQKDSGRLLSELLLENDGVNEYDLARVIVEQYQVPFVDLSGYAFHKDLIEVFPPRLLHLNAIIPLDRYGKQVSFACQEIPSEEVAHELKKYAPDGMYFFVALALEIRHKLHEHAPLGDADLAGPAKDAGEPAIPVGKIKEDTAWKALFDTANESVMTELETTPGGSDDD